MQNITGCLIIMEHPPQKSHYCSLQVHYSMHWFSVPGLTCFIQRAVRVRSRSITCLSLCKNSIYWFSPKYSLSSDLWHKNFLSQSQSLYFFCSQCIFLHGFILLNSSRVVVPTIFCSEAHSSVYMMWRALSSQPATFSLHFKTVNFFLIRRDNKYLLPTHFHNA